MRSSIPEPPAPPPSTLSLRSAPPTPPPPKLGLLSNPSVPPAGDRALSERPAPPARELAHLAPTPPSTELTQLDTELHRLARGAGRLRLRIGQALHRLADGIHELGFSTLGAYALERCCRGGRWAAETRTLARRLDSLPHLTEALESGSIGWSMAELLARHATPQAEAALLQVARGKSVQAMRIALSPPESQGSPTSPTPPDDDDLTRTLSLTVPLEQAWALDATRMIVEHMDGTHTSAHFLESLLAEATIPLLDLPTPTQANEANQGKQANQVDEVDEANEANEANQADQADQANQANQLNEANQLNQANQTDQTDVSAQMEAEHTAWRAQMQRLQHLQAEAELRSPAAANPNRADPNPGDAPDADDLPLGLEALDARIRHYSAELASRDLFFGRMAQRFLTLRGWQPLGFVSEAHYARERLGMSRASLRSKVSLARRSQGLAQITDALQQGQIGFEAAHLIARIAKPTTEHAWLTRATHRTFKHLREDVQAAEMQTRLTGHPNHSPPTKSQIEQMQTVERAILSGDLLRKIIHTQPPDQAQPTETNDHHQRTGSDESDAPSKHAPSAQTTPVQISVTPNHEPNAVQISGSPKDEAPTEEAPTEPVQISGSRGAKVTLRIRVPGDLLLHYRQLERLHRNKLPNTGFIQFLCTTFWQTWVPMLGVSDKWETIYRRDRYRCTSPVCHQRNVTLHHVKYRASGGTDAPNNLTSPCAFCHLEGEHGGRLKILPPGSDPTWLLGRHPIIRVHRRERTLLA